jgi:hypothetical protein
MVERINLPRVTLQKDAKAHPFPLQVAFQTQEFIQGALFYFILADEAAGIFFRTSNSINTLEEKLLKEGMRKPDWELSWKIFLKYKGTFEKMVYRNVLVTIRSHWDWYLNKLAEFIIFAQEKTGNSLTNKEIKQLLKLTYKEINEQVETIENICSLDFNISVETKQYIKEMSLVRNLGLHNRWEVDQQYLDKTTGKNIWQKGDIRKFDNIELGLWHKSLIDLIDTTWQPIAIKYLSAPMYSPAS